MTTRAPQQQHRQDIDEIDGSSEDLVAAATSLSQCHDALRRFPWRDEVRMARGSLAHEPPSALDGGVDGLAVIRRLLTAAPGALRPGGTLLLEVGAGQADAIRAIAPAGAMLDTRTDMAGIELTVSARQCLARRIERKEDPERHVAAWEEERNERGDQIRWRFTTADALIKLRRLYPTL